MINCSFTKQKARKTAVACNSHHRQGISLLTDRKTRIDFEKTCGTDLFCNSVPCLTVKIDPEDENSTLASQSAEKRRFREISPAPRHALVSWGCFSDPNFFRISIDPFSIFFRVEGFELPKTHFFQNFITNESNTKDLNPRQGLGLFRFFVLVTKCLHTASGCHRLCFSLLGAEIQPAVFVLFIRHFCFLSHLVPKRHRFISLLFYI